MALLFLVFLIISSPCCTIASLCPSHNHPDAAALLSFKNAIISDPLHVLSAWTLPPHANCSSTTFCRWNGVTCKSHRVVALQLNASRLLGTVSPSLAQLPFLRSLNLSSNNFSGTVPVELGKLRLSLISLDLSQNQLSGSIPVELGMLNRLGTLYLSENELTGGVPAALANCTALADLLLYSNGLSGNIPVELGMLNQLWRLYLWGNDLTGVVPAAALANCTALTLLDLSHNRLSGSIPVELGMFNRLEILYLEYNELMGGVSEALANCTTLTGLSLSSNRLSGSIPVELGMLNQLELLYVHSSELTGVVPAALANCTALTLLDLSYNRLAGSIPVELGMLNQLGILFLQSNELTGGVPAALSNCSALVNLALYSNLLSGSIPVEFGMLNQLGQLVLFENELTGGMPTALANCTALRELAFNRLSGSIPVELGMLNLLGSLTLSENELTGEVPAALANCTALTGLALQSNRLSGSIPVELGKLNQLDGLNLGGNELRGEVPVTLANCTALTGLALYSNRLSGSILHVFDNLSSLGGLALSDNLFSGLLPSSLTQLELLSIIDLDGNEFVGPIPEFSSRFLNYLDISNNNLSGPIPESLGTSLLGLVSFDLSHNLLSGQLPRSLGSLQRLTVLNLSNNEFSGSIPSTLGSCAELLILNLSHNKLTGKLPSSFASLQSLTEMDLSYNQLEGLVPNIKPFNDTKLVDLRDNPMLCGPIVNRNCNASVQGSFQGASSKLKWTVPLAVVLAGLLLLLGIVIWRHRNLVGCSPNIRDLYGTFGKKQLKVSADELREATDGFSEANILGEGGVSTVYRAVLADDVVAVKILKPGLVNRVSTDAEVARMKREIELLAMVRHRNIVRVRGCCFNLDMQAIILDLMPNGNLDTYLHGIQRQEALTKDQKMRLLRGIAQGLEYLHHWHDPRKTIVHCDVKPANILLDEEWEPRIADFGIAKLLEQGDEVLHQPSSSILLRGSIGYIPPEYAFCTQVSSAGDVYSFGVVMLEILTCKRPTEVGSSTHLGGEQQQTLMSLVQAAYPYQLLGLFETPGMMQDDAIALAQLALSCTSPAPTQRPTMLQVGRGLDAITSSVLSTDTPTVLQLAGL